MSYQDWGFSPSQDDFDAAAAAPTGDFSPMPDGEYEVILDEASWKDTRSGGSMLAMQLQVVTNGPYFGRKVWDNFQRSCPTSAKAEQIGRGQITRLCMALGLRNGFRDPAELLGRPFVVRLKTEPGRDPYGPKNRIASIIVREGSGGAPAAPAAAPAPKRPAGPPRVADVKEADASW